MDWSGPDELATRLNARKQEVAAPPPSCVFLAASGGRALAQLTVKSDRLLDGTGCVMAFAAEAASAAGLSDGPRGTDGRDPCPRAFQVVGDLFRDAAPGTLTAEAAVTFRGRSTRVVEVNVRDERDRLVARVAVTQLAAGRVGSPPAARPASR